MTVALLKTKLYIPYLRPSLVSRPRLIEKLNQGLQTGSKLTLISASAGFGKTTLLSEWITSCGKPVAWVSLDKGDNDAVRFISYLIAALQTIREGIGEGLLAAIQSPQPLQVGTILAILLNEISAIPDQFLLILDDYHALDSPSVDQALSFIIERQPPHMHLVLATREDPFLPLARLRARGQLLEVRDADLRFTLAEAAEFLNRIMGLNLSEGEIAALDARTEGWIAGLQLAALSMQGDKDAAAFIQSFTGSNRFVLDYLIEEVLQQQTESVQAFLMSTSILERMCGPLCDAILRTPSGSGEATLLSIERANLFIVPLDNDRCWYRYQHLLEDLLRKRLGQSLTPEKIAELHIRASEWHENNNLILSSFRHAASANDVERAIRLMESKQMPIHVRGTATTILAWLESLPITARNTRPVLWWKQAALMLEIGQTNGVEEKLQAAETALNDASDGTNQDLIGKIALTRATLAQMLIQVDTIFEQARRALEYLPSNNLSHRSSATCALGYAYYWQGNWDEANRAYAEALSLSQTAEDTPNSILALIRLGQLQKDQNQLHLAAENYQRALHLFDNYSNPNAILAYLGLTETFYKWNDLDAAEQYALQGLKLAQQYDQVYDRIIMSKLHLALIKLARGDISHAAELVSQAEQTARQNNYPPRQPNIAYFKTWIYLKQGDLDAVAALASQTDMPLMQARMLIRQADPSTALELLEPIRQEAITQGMTARLIDVMAVQSVALYAHDEKEKAVDLLAKLLALTEPEGCIRPFLEEGEPMRLLIVDYRLLIEKNSRDRDHFQRGFVDTILAAFDQRGGMPQSKISNQKFETIDPLSPRELEVLRLIAEGLSNQEICQRLFLALDTVKGHNRRIFDKLQVQRRTEAIGRARELDLL